MSTRSTPQSPPVDSHAYAESLYGYAASGSTRSASDAGSSGGSCSTSVSTTAAPRICWRKELAGGNRWGIVSDVDLLRATESEDIDEQQARTLAAQPVVTIASSEALSHAAQLMVERDVSHLIVLESRSARPIGVLSTLDVARALAGFPEQHPAFR